MRKSASILIFAALLGGCSSDVMRFGDPFSNPFTGSTSRQSSRTELFKRQEFPKTAKVRASDSDIVTGSVRKIDEVKKLPYNENVERAWENRGTIKNALKLPPKPLQMQMKTGGWSPIGGTSITAKAGDTVKSLSERYGVPASAIAMANGVETNASVSGRSIVIPTYSVGNKAVAAKTITPEKIEKTGITGLKSQKKTNDTKLAQDILAPKKQAPSYARGKREHVVASGDSMGSLANRYNVKSADIAKANGMTLADGLKIGKALTIPAVGAVVVAKAVTKPVKQDMITTGSITPAKKVSAVKPVQEKTAVLTPATVAGEPDFRWPLRSARVISNFGDDLNGVNNEGINFSAPEGTEIRASDDGEVAYASTGAKDPNLKTYGNLVLIRHADRYVTAYAHAKDVTVKVGEKVKRGQVIGHVGQSGSVSAPQLHFEIRQGKTSIDPEKMVKS
jgi:murein DD-endopeptidase MepM/ murein hydrolase activator NlpD